MIQIHSTRRARARHGLAMVGDAGRRRIRARHASPLLVCSVLWASLCGAEDAAQAAEIQEERPNIILIIADDLSWKHLGAYGSREVATPHIDRLAAEGVVFEHAFVSTSSCTPSRAAVLTGRNGFELAEGATLWGYLPARFHTYTELLADSGYVVGATGKGWAPGFLIDREVNPAGKPYNEATHEPYAEWFEDSDQIHISRIDYAANLEAFLDANESKEAPFAFWIGTFEPHRGFTPGLAAALGLDSNQVSVPGFLPPDQVIREDIAEYYAEIMHIDAQVGRVMQALEARQQERETLIIFTSDNGMAFPRAKATLYDYGTRMPLIVWSGSGVAKGRRISELVSLTDIAPTILQLAGLEVPESLSGMSLVPWLDAEEEVAMDWRQEVVMYRERHGFHEGSGGKSYPSRAIRTRQHLMIWNLRPDALPKDVDGGPAKSFLESRSEEYEEFYELTFGQRPEIELYDIAADQYQMRNLASDTANADLMDELRQRLLAYLRDRGDARILGDADADAYRFAPYFGLAFQEGFLKWTPTQQGQTLSFDERRELLKRAFSMLDEEDFFEEMIRRQEGRL